MFENVKHVVVDLDGTLVRTDLFVESILRYLKGNPFKVINLIRWLMAGRAFAKQKVAEQVDIEAEFLPYEDGLVEYLKELKAEGKELILATASHRKYADQVAAHLGIFDRVMATEDNHNLKGQNKLAAIRELIGDADFAYAGDSAADTPIWRAAAANIMVNAPAANVAEAKSEGKLVWQGAPEKPVWKAFVKEMRPHQYAKNMLIFVPIVTSHDYFDGSHVMATILAFICARFSDGACPVAAQLFCRIAVLFCRYQRLFLLSQAVDDGGCGHACHPLYAAGCGGCGGLRAGADIMAAGLLRLYLCQPCLHEAVYRGIGAAG
mgnify:CR=1 FL=1